jgi:hypothetical protein
MADEGSAKKRSTYLLTHGKTNDSPAHESNQNRFRIYFESPPEADRVPQALRRNPYKRWRREDSAAPIGAQDGKKADTALPEITEGAEVDTTEVTTDHKTENAEVDSTVLDSTETVPAPSDPVVNEDDLAGTEAVVADAVSSEGVDVAPTVTDGHDGVAPEVTDPVVESAAATETEIPEVTDAPALTTDDQDTEIQPVSSTQVESAEPLSEGASAEAHATSDAVADVGEQTTTLPSSETTEATASAMEATIGQEGSATATAPAAAEPVTDEKTAAALAKSAENAASAYKTRTRRRSSVSSTDSRDTVHVFQPEVTPSLNRLSILYEGSQRRMCFDAEVVEKIRVHREEGRIEVMFLPVQEKEDDVVEDDGETANEGLLPKGYLVSFLLSFQRFDQLTR